MLHRNVRPADHRKGEYQPHGRSDAWHRLDLGVSTVALDDAVHLSEPETGSRLAFRREERLECPLANFCRHADARVADLDADFTIRRVRPNCEDATPDIGSRAVLTRFSSASRSSPAIPRTITPEARSRSN